MEVFAGTWTGQGQTYTAREAKAVPGLLQAREKCKRDRGTHAVKDSWTGTCTQEDLDKRNRGTRAGRDSRGVTREVSGSRP